ncbi:unnamed protein product [Blepharisma stoltei]|uniref:Uncharacterized protein n=1 Tax=Blepharisma stoltei TaxID=1481888 RepID=A0AAU9KDF5_9CILI|nr:unnamed protein product [Blepharisma stoltei]
MPSLSITSIYGEYVINVPETFGSVYSIANQVEEISGIPNELQEYYHLGEEVYNYDTRTMDLQNPLQLVRTYDLDPRNIRFRCSEEICRIVINVYDKTKAISVHNGEPIRLLCLYVRDNFRIPIRKQNWFYEDRYIRPAKSGEYIDIKRINLIKVVEDVRGGGPPTLEIDFNDLEKIIEIGFSETAPPWRYVSKGLSFIGICKNENCAAFNKKVISCHGFGIFSLASVPSRCPVEGCKMYIEPDNCGFWFAKWKFRGLTDKREVKTGEGTAGYDKFTTFEEGNSTKWRELKFEVISLW